LLSSRAYMQAMKVRQRVSLLFGIRARVRFR